MKKLIIVTTLILYFSLSKSYSKNDFYEKIDTFGEVLENIKKEYVDEIN